MTRGADHGHFEGRARSARLGALGRVGSRQGVTGHPLFTALGKPPGAHMRDRGTVLSCRGRGALHQVEQFVCQSGVGDKAGD